MKRVYITTIVTAILALAIFATAYSVWDRKLVEGELKVGFICENDESTPYTYNFMLAQSALTRALPGKVKIYSRSNVPDSETLEPIHELVRAGCEIIFTNSYSEQVLEAARQYPKVQFCQGSFSGAERDGLPDNYHTFNGEIYQGRYASGVAAGMKLRDMLDNHVITADQALVGYVGAFSTPEVISGYTAFLLGVRSVAPEATMRVRYTGTWSSYSREKAGAKALIDEGCIVIAQHTDTIGPAMACEEAEVDHRIIHVGYNQDMTDIAPSTSLISCCVNWTPYVVSATEAVMNHEDIERHVSGSVHGNDISAGFDQGWVQVLDLNRQIAAYGTEERLQRTIEALKKGSLEVFKGDYTGVNPDDPSDTIDLKQGYKECEKGSWSTFHYVLDDVVTVEG